MALLSLKILIRHYLFILSYNTWIVIIWGWTCSLKLHLMNELYENGIFPRVGAHKRLWYLLIGITASPPASFLVRFVCRRSVFGAPCLMSFVRGKGAGGAGAGLASSRACLR